MTEDSILVKMTKTGQDVHMAPKRGSRRESAGVPGWYDASSYPAFAVTVDIAILTVIDGQLHVLLVQRREDPYGGTWALPGGFKTATETLDEAAARELAEETGVRAPAHLAQLGAYGDPGRDPRTNVVTVAYVAVVPDVGVVAAGTDAADARLWVVNDLLVDGAAPLAFDHGRILRDAIERTASDLDQKGLAPSFLRPTFTLSELQAIYEAVWGHELDPGNFRRSLALDARGDRFVVPTGHHAAAGPKGGRPPELFRAGPAWSSGSPVRRRA